jgi:uncharacterized tellurite resistance protein B-like protein
MSKREEYQAHMEEELALWSARFDALKARAGTSAKAEILAQLERWHEGMQAAAAKLAQLKDTSGDAWDLVKVELDEAWHAIAPVLDGGEPRSRNLTAEEVQALTHEQQDAILEAMVIAVVADGKVDEEEIARFNSELAKVPWTQPKEDVVKKAQAAQARVAGLANDDERRAMLMGIAARLPHGAIAEKTLGMMALVMTADGPANAAERGALAVFASAFGIGQDRLATIASSLRGA